MVVFLIIEIEIWKGFRRLLRLSFNHGDGFSTRYLIFPRSGFRILLNTTIACTRADARKVVLYYFKRTLRTLFREAVDFKIEFTWAPVLDTKSMTCGAFSKSMAMAWVKTKTKLSGCNSGMLRAVLTAEIFYLLVSLIVQFFYYEDKLLFTCAVFCEAVILTTKIIEITHLPSIHSDTPVHFPAW